MPQPLAGPGVPLPLVQEYPASLFNAPFQMTGNEVTLPAGMTFPLPAGYSWVDLGSYCVLQFLDPVTGTWRNMNSQRRHPTRVWSDGFNIRVANLLGCPAVAVVTNGGSGYAQATTTAVSGAGNSTWQPVVGGTITISVTAAGSGYTIPPLLAIDPPPPPGVQATAYAAITSGTISSITVDNQGAGYQAAPGVQVIPCPTDPSLGSIVNGTATASIISGNQGKVICVLCTNPGSTQATAPSLTIAGAGTSAAGTISLLQTVTGATISSGGAGYNATSQIVSVGGRPAGTPAFTNPAVELGNWIPRPAILVPALTGTTLSSISAVYDGGLFLGTPTPLILTQSIVTTLSSLTFTMGSLADSIIIQPA